MERDIAPLSAAWQVPPLSIQPLLENAVYHGIQPLPDGGCVRLALHEHADSLIVEVANHPLPADAPAHNGGAGIALANIRDRLQAIYGARAALGTGSDGDRYVARLVIPAERAK